MELDVGLTKEVRDELSNRGCYFEIVFRRGRPKMLATLPPNVIPAVEIHLATAEAVAAGGATVSASSCWSGIGGGSKRDLEGLQSRAVDQMALLPRMEAAVDAEPVVIGKRNPVTLNAITVR